MTAYFAGCVDVSTYTKGRARLPHDPSVIEEVLPDRRSGNSPAQLTRRSFIAGHGTRLLQQSGYICPTWTALGNAA